MSVGGPKAGGMLQNARAKLESQVRLLLLWLAASDGELQESELEFVASKSPSSAGTISRDDFLAVIGKSDIASIEKAVRAVAAENREVRAAFLEMAITLALVDRDLDITENHILRFYADALHLGTGMLKKRFQTITGMLLPNPGDPGDPDWWGEAGPGEPVNSVNSGSVIDEHVHTPEMTIAQAEAVLGVGLHATPEDIERAYRNLAGVFQPNPDLASAEKAITDSRFRKIQQAYQLLKGRT